MTRFFLFSTGWLSLTFLVMGCNPTQKTTHKTNDIQVLESYQSHVIRGAGAPKGMKIGIKALTPSQQTLDSITYEGWTKKIETIKTLVDTTWSEVIFYPKNVVNGKPEDSDHQFSKNNCTLHYTEGEKVKNLPISNLQMQTDNTFWK